MPKELAAKLGTAELGDAKPKAQRVWPNNRGKVEGKPDAQAKDFDSSLAKVFDKVVAKIEGTQQRKPDPNATTTPGGCGC